MYGKRRTGEKNDMYVCVCMWTYVGMWIYVGIGMYDGSCPYVVIPRYTYT